MNRSLLVRGLLASFFLAGLLTAQGKDNYLNFEAGENEALAVIRVADVPGTGPQTFTSYLLIANTVDDSVEVRTINTNALVARIPTGQAPIGVHVKPTEEALGPHTYRPSGSEPTTVWKLAYSVNWIGDSITLMGFRHEPQSGGGQNLVARALRTVWVGDEPTSIAVQPQVAGVAYTLPGSLWFESLIVTHGTPGQWDVRDPVTLEAYTNGIVTWSKLEMLENGQNRAVKEAWQVKYGPTIPGVNPTFSVLNRRGGNYWTSPVPTPQVPYAQIASNPNYSIAALPQVNSNPDYDFDVWGPIDPLPILVSSPITSIGPRIGELGSTNFAMAFAPNGDLYVVGQIARNNDAAVFPTATIIPNGESVHAGMESGATGFAQSMIWRLPAGGGPVERIDLNAGTGTRITQPTGVLIRGTGGPGTEIFVTGFNSDSLARITYPGGAFISSTITRADLSHATNPFPTFNGTNLTGRMMGPRSLALYEEPGQPARLFVLNKIDRSYYVIDPSAFPTSSAGLSLVSLAIDPRPSYIKDGQPFLYSSRLSTKGQSSCAGCHIDGHFDGLTWTLSGIPGPVTTGPLVGAFPNTPNKGPMFTQSLRGLATFEVGSSKPTGAAGIPSNAGQRLFTTEPLHWRGDKGFFEDFNAAFVNLLALSAPPIPAWVFIDPTNPDLNRGIPIPDMEKFRDFVFSIHYPPNADQMRSRTYSGIVGANAFGGTGTSPTIGTAASGSVGGQLGLELFFENQAGDPSCVSCHMLPVGTNNIPTENFANALDTGVLIDIETAALRGLFSKEKRLTRLIRTPAVVGGPPIIPSFVQVGQPAVAPPPFAGGFPAMSLGAVTGEFGLTHTGNNHEVVLAVPPFIAAFASESAQAFTHGFIFGNPAERDDLAAFEREFDTGTAPIIGFTVLFDAITSTNPTVLATRIGEAIEILQQAERANAGAAVRARLGGVDRGFYYDVPSLSFVEESFVGPAGTTPLAPLSPAALLGLLGSSGSLDDSIVLVSVPLGSERRFANLLPTPTQPIVAASGAVSGITLGSMTPNSANERIPSFPRIAMGLGIFNPTTFARAGKAFVGPQPIVSSDAMWFAMAFLNGAGPMFNLPVTMQHAAPRRFAVAGNGILPGAKLRIWMPEQADVNSALPPVAPLPNTWNNWTPPSTVPSIATHEYIEMPIYPRISVGSTQPIWETAAEIDPANLYGLMHGGPNSIATVYVGGNATYNLALNYANPAWAPANFYSSSLLTGTINAVGVGFNSNDIQNFYIAIVWPILQAFPQVFGPERWNWYYVEIVNTHRPTAGAAAAVTTVSQGGWQRLKF